MGFFKKRSVYKSSGRNGVQTALIDNNSTFAIQEAYNSVRTNIMFSLPNDNKSKVLILTSPSPGEGKTTTCINLAITLALGGSKVLLIDADMRKPRVHSYLNVRNESGLSGLLNKFITLKETINHSSKYYFDFITSGIIPPNPAELISSDEAMKLIDDLKGHYDYILIDTPPVNVVTDAVTLSKASDGVIIVTRQNSTTHDAVSKAISNLKFADAKILGFILNDAKAVGLDRPYYKKSYGYGYAYGRTGERKPIKTKERG